MANLGLNIRRDPLCLIQISSGKSAHIVQLIKQIWPSNRLDIKDEKVAKIFHYGSWFGLY